MMTFNWQTIWGQLTQRNSSGGAIGVAMYNARCGHWCYTTITTGVCCVCGVRYRCGACQEAR